MILRLVLDVPADTLVQQIMKHTTTQNVGEVIQDALIIYYSRLFETLDVPNIRVTEIVYESTP
jgi:hypothetical protein